MLYDDKESGRAKLVGVIVADGGLNMETWITEARAQGYVVEKADGRALLYIVGKK